MKNLKKSLETIYKEIRAIADRFEKLVTTISKTDAPKARTAKVKPTKKAHPKKPVSKKKDQRTAFDTVMEIIRRSKKGVSAGQLKERTGYDDKKIANIIYKAKKNGLIKSKTKGVYVKA